MGNFLSLDFVNTKLELDTGPVELLTSNEDLVRWLIAARVLPSNRKKPLERAWALEGEAGLVRLREFRETLREAVLQIEAGQALSDSILTRINSLLSRTPWYDQLIRNGDNLERRRLFDPKTPADALEPILDDAAAMLASIDKTRLRKCDTCVVQFYDASKKGTRRWCSMRLCGNRHKVASYFSRKREADEA